MQGCRRSSHTLTAEEVPLVERSPEAAGMRKLIKAGWDYVVMNANKSFPQVSLTLVERDGKVREVHFGRSARKGAAPSTGLASDFESYLSGKAVDFADYELDMSGYTEFEKAVLKAARAIPYGETRTYGEVANMAGSPGAARAVGRALGKNRFCPIVPCHRVVAANGLGGFTGGIEWKIALLSLEGSLDRVTRGRSNSRSRRGRPRR